MKKAIIYGNCHANAIKDILKNNAVFSENYSVCEIPAIQEIKDASFFEPGTFGDCDLFIHQSIKIDNRYGKEFASENIIKMLKPDCKVIAIPNVYHLPKCFFPQYYEATELRDEKARKTFFFRDCIIDNGINAGKDVSQIIEDYENSDYFLSEDLEGQYKGFIDKVRMRETDWDIKVSDFIEREHTSRQLFFDPNHPTNYFLEYVAWQTLSFLFPDKNIEFESVEGSLKQRLDSYEMPVCASVYKTFGFAPEDKLLRRMGTKLRRKPMDLREYIIEYQAKCYLVDDFSESVRRKSRQSYRKMSIGNLPVKLGIKIKRFFSKLK